MSYDICNELAQWFLGAILVTGVFFYWLGRRDDRMCRREAASWREHLSQIEAGDDER